MKSQVSLEKLAVLIRAKRGSRGLREVAEEIGEVSASTLSRIETGKTPDLDTFLRLCDWLGIQPNDLVASQMAGRPLVDSKQLPVPGDMSTPGIVEAHLRADKELDPETAEALSQMIRAAYKAVVDGKFQRTRRSKGAGRKD
jgi:transcriptional regulator with XRE-family HTH domain